MPYTSNNQATRDFSKRLKYKLIEKGYASERSVLGVQIKELSHVAGCTRQNARRFVSADALPNFSTLEKIATWLEVSPSWLLYGEQSQDLASKNNKLDELIEVEKDVYHCLFSKILLLDIAHSKIDEVIELTSDLLIELSRTHATKEMKMTMIDLAFKSIKRYYPIRQNKEEIDHESRRGAT